MHKNKLKKLGKREKITEIRHVSDSEIKKTVILNLIRQRASV